MKKITLLFAVFVLTLNVQAYAQETPPLTKNVDQVEYNDEIKEVKKAKKSKRKKANKQHVKSMRKVARADGNVSPKEKAVIKKERKKMKRKGKRMHERNEVRRKHLDHKKSDTKEKIEKG